MKIAIIIDQYLAETNGTTTSTRRFVQALREKGHEVRVITTEYSSSVERKDIYTVKERYVPVATEFAHKHGFQFAKPEKDLIRKVLTGVDVVHFLVPFKLEKVAYKIAQEMGIPCTAAYHVQAENVTSSIGLGKVTIANNFVYSRFKKFFENFDHIHCPSNFIAEEIEAHGFPGKKHIISNGINELFYADRTEKSEHLKDKFVIVAVGRMSIEKRHDVLINAVAQSPYKDSIFIQFAGKGPKLGYYKSLVEKQGVHADFGFFTGEELAKLENYADLYVHTADAEIEAISCIEAFACGLVPVIAQSNKSATKQFALCDESLFEPGNAEKLSERISYWIEHPEIRTRMSEKYIEYGKMFALSTSVDKIIKMFEEEIKDFKSNKIA